MGLLGSKEYDFQSNRIEERIDGCTCPVACTGALWPFHHSSLAGVLGQLSSFQFAQLEYAAAWKLSVCVDVNVC